MKRISAIIVSFLFVASFHIEAQQKNDQPNRGRLVWSAFECSTYAEMSRKKDDQLRLFKLGYAIGKEFLNDVNDNNIGEAELERMPTGMRLVLGGPSIEWY
jgi:hypothetical protein